MPRTSIESPYRCRQCGAPLVGRGRRSVCPRCHPEETVQGSQLEFSLAPSAPPEPDLDPPSAADGAIFGVEPIAGETSSELEPAADEIVFKPEPAVEEATPASLVSAERESPPLEPEESSPSNPLEIAPARRSLRQLLAIFLGAIIVIGGLSWAGFQMWPRGSVERSIVQAFEALPHFTERTGNENPLGALSVAAEGSPTFADLNGDGLLDFITGSQSGELRVYLNAGARKRPRFLRPSEVARGLVATDTSNTVTFANLRGVGLLDALNAGTNGLPTYFANRGTPQQPEFLLISPEQDPFAVTVPPAGSYDWRPVFADIDRDGDFDLFVGTRDGSILFGENRGNPQKPHFRGVTRVSPFGLRGFGALISLAFGDLDGDGDLDAIAGNATGKLHFLENRGNAWRPKFHLAPAGALGLPIVDREATVALADLDGDTDLDLITGSADGRFRYFENLSTPVPSPAPEPGSP